MEQVSRLGIFIYSIAWDRFLMLCRADACLRIVIPLLLGIEFVSPTKPESRGDER